MNVDGRNIVTDDEAATFMRYLRQWQAKLGLQDWRIVLSPRPAKKGVMAEMDKFDWRQRQVTCRLGRDWFATPVTPATLEQTAVHELLHVVFFEMMMKARDPAASDDELASIEHRVINLLENLLVPVEQA